MIYARSAPSPSGTTFATVSVSADVFLSVRADFQPGENCFSGLTDPASLEPKEKTMESDSARAAEPADVRRVSFSRNVKRGRSAERTIFRPDFTVYE